MSSIFPIFSFLYAIITMIVKLTEVIMYRFYEKIETDNKLISHLFTVPMRNLQNWAKADNNDWRKAFYYKLNDFSYLTSVYMIKHIKNKFTKDELILMIESTNGISFELENSISDNWLQNFKEFCYYQKFDNNEYFNNLFEYDSSHKSHDIKINNTLKSIILKFKELDDFAQYTLITFLHEWWDCKANTTLDEYLHQIL